MNEEVFNITFVVMLFSVWFVGFFSMMSSVDSYIHLGDFETSVWTLFILSMLVIGKIIFSSKKETENLERLN